MMSFLSSRSAGRSRATAAALLVVLLWIVVLTLAAASPVDPVWVPGFYDAADFDDVVTGIGALTALCEGLGPPALSLECPVRRSIEPGDEKSAHPSRPALRGRAPPHA